MTHGRDGSALATVWAIGLNTFREAIRDRILYLLLAFALILIGVSRLLSLLTVGSESKIIKDVGLSAISVFGVLTAMFVGVSLVFKEIDKRTIFTLLANPVRRWQFVAGKYLGLLTVLAMNVAMMTVALSVLLWWKGEQPWALAGAVLLTYVELLLVAAFALLFSSFTNPILAAVGTFGIYAIGHLSWSLQMLKDKLPGNTLAVWLCDALYWVLPNLGRLNIRSEAVHAIALPDGYLAFSLSYGLSYAVAVLTLACIVFERREFQ